LSGSYTLENISDEDLHFTVTLPSGIVVDDVFKAREVVVGICNREIIADVFHDFFPNIIVEWVPEPKPKSAWMTEGF